MKFERNLDAEVVDFCVLSDDYSKLVLLASDRSLMFHARFGGLVTSRACAPTTRATREQGPVIV